MDARPLMSGGPEGEGREGKSRRERGRKEGERERGEQCFLTLERGKGVACF